jgi:Toxin PAAR-like domain
MPAIFPGSTTASGQCLGFPDVCLTPAPPAPSPIPIPYPNIGMLMQASKTSTKVKFVSKPVVIKTSEIPSTSGDEAGVNKGVASGTNMDKATFKMGSAKVKVEGKDVIILTSMTGHNGMSANMPAGAVIAPSQTKVILSP